MNFHTQFDGHAYFSGCVGKTQPPTSCTSSRPEDMGNGTFAMSDSRAYKEFADVDLRSSVFGGLKKTATNKVPLDM